MTNLTINDSLLLVNKSKVTIINNCESVNYKEEAEKIVKFFEMEISSKLYNNILDILEKKYNMEGNIR